MAQEFNAGLISVVVNFFESLDVPFTKRTLKQNLESNPYYPSLYSIHKVLNRYNIKNEALQIEKEQLSKLPFPFLAYAIIKETGIKNFVNVTNVTDDSVTFFYEKETTVTNKDFLDNWSNIVLLAETTAKSREPNFEANKRVEILDRSKKYLLLFGFSLILLSAVYKLVITANYLIPILSILLFTFLGLTISILLLIYEIDKSNTFVKNICTGGVKTNCDAVLGSRASKFFGISWAEVGFFYFSFFALFLLIPGISFNEKILYVSYISVLSALYIPFSLYYQHKVVKQWCRLCLFVQATLFLNLLWALGFGDFSFNLSITNIAFFILCAIFPALSWYALKPILIKAKDSDKFLAAYKRLYTRPDIFNLTLADQPQAPAGWQNLGIHKGSPNAENVILKVCSPSCYHCSKAHEVLNDVLSANENVKLITIYSVTNEEQDNRRFPVKHFLALAEQENGIQAQAAMDYWYLNEDRNYDTLKTNFPVSEDLLKKQTYKIDQMREWCKTAEIEYTPTVFVNGKKLPGTFNLSDLKDVFL